MRLFRFGARRGALLGLTVAGAVGCGSVVDPPLPGGAERFAPPPVYARWWSQVEACSGRAGALAAVRWYVVPGAGSVRGTDGRELDGYYSAPGHRVVLAGRSARDGGTVRHEMLHALLGASARGHPPAYFQGQCGGWVDCPAVGCADEGPPGPPPSADAPVLAAADLRLTAEVLPPVVTRVSGDSGATVVVRVTNPRAVAVWVQLAPPPGCAAGCPEFAEFGFGIAPTGTEGTSQGEIRLTTASRFPLGAGETRVQVFDADLAGYPAGVYVARASFNAGDLSFRDPRAVAAPFRIER